MFNSFNFHHKNIDRIVGCLSSTGEEGRALKLCRSYRKTPDEAVAVEAIAALNGLNENKLIELKQAARI